MYADVIIDELLKRGGFDAWWEQIDEEIQLEIKDALNRVVVKKMNADVNHPLS